MICKCNRLEVVGLQRNKVGNFGANMLAKMWKLKYLDLRWVVVFR